MEPCAAAVLAIVSDPNAGDQGVHVNDVSGVVQLGLGRGSAAKQRGFVF